MTENNTIVSAVRELLAITPTMPSPDYIAAREKLFQQLNDLDSNTNNIENAARVLHKAEESNLTWEQEGDGCKTRLLSLAASVIVAANEEIVTGVNPNFRVETLWTCAECNGRTDAYPQMGHADGCRTAMVKRRRFVSEWAE